MKEQLVKLGGSETCPKCKTLQVTGLNLPEECPECLTKDSESGANVPLDRLVGPTATITGVILHRNEVYLMCKKGTEIEAVPLCLFSKQGHAEEIAERLGVPFGEE